jgi:hypothetical protein
LDQELLKELLEKVAKRFGYSDPELWQDGIFGQLSEDIEKETRFIISRNTLKRLFGKIKTSEHYNPQIDTRNALAQYAGFPDWNKFRMEIMASQPDNSISEKSFGNEVSYSNPRTESVFKKIPKKVFWLTGILILLGVLIRYWPKPETDFSRIKIEVQNPIDTAPFTLVVKYDIPEDIEDSIYLGVGGARFLLKKDKKLYVHSLYQPIYSFVYLRTKTKTIRAIAIKAYSRDLECYYENGKNVLLVPHSEFLGDGNAGLKRSFFATNNLDSSDFTTRFVKVKDFKVDGDNFKFKCRFKVDKSPKICHNFQFKLFADSGHHEMEVFNKGCAQYNFVAPAEKYFGGKFEDLTGLSVSSGVWHDLEMKVVKKLFTLHIDGKKQFETKYTKTMAQTNVLIFQFNGFGQIDYYQLRDNKDQLVEGEEF